MCVDKKSSIDSPTGSKTSNDCPSNAVLIGANNVNGSLVLIFQLISLELATEYRDEIVVSLLPSASFLKRLHNIEY
jgi:hypothetical protein